MERHHISRGCCWKFQQGRVVCVGISDPLYFVCFFPLRTASMIDAREMHMHALDSVAYLFADSWIAEQMVSSSGSSHAECQMTGTICHLNPQPEKTLGWSIVFANWVFSQSTGDPTYSARMFSARLSGRRLCFSPPPCYQ